MTFVRQFNSLFLTLAALLPIVLVVFLRTPYFPPLPKHGAIVVTGAGSGIGAHVASRFANRFPNHTVYGVVRRAEQSKDLEAVGVFPLVADMTDTDALREAFHILRKEQSVVGFFDSAGIPTPNSPVECVDVAYMIKLYDVDIFGLFATLQQVIPGLRSNPGSRVVLLGSVSAAVTPSYMGMDTARSIETVADAGEN